MKLEWQRPGIVAVTARVEELATLVAGTRLAEQALAARGEDSSALARVLADFDRAGQALRRTSEEHRSTSVTGPTSEGPQ
jgi:hypothetical protein